MAISIKRIARENRAELSAAVYLLSAAFHGNALFVKAMPHGGIRHAVLRLLFKAYVADAACYGGIHVAEDDGIHGALLWYPPNAYPMTTVRIIKQLSRFLPMTIISPRGIAELKRAGRDFDKRRPREPHCYASFLAGSDGARVSFQLSRALIEEADAHDWPIYLETQNSRTVALYHRMGFEIMDDGFEYFSGGPLTWTMWRPSATSRVEAEII